jgi:hypothetical protein
LIYGYGKYVVLKKEARVYLKSFLENDAFFHPFQARSIPAFHREHSFYRLKKITIFITN